MEQAGKVILQSEHVGRSFLRPNGSTYEVLGDVSFLSLIHIFITSLTAMFAGTGQIPPFQAR